MLRPMLIGKIHRATVTQANLDYVGSITIDADLLDAADVLPGQQVGIDGDGAHVVQVGFGHRRAMNLADEHRAEHRCLPALGSDCTVRR